MMASQSSSHSDSQKTRRKTPHAPKTLEYKRDKLLDNAQRVVKATSGKNLGRLLLRKTDSQDIIIQCPQTQLAKMAQILVDNKLMRLA